MLVRNIMMNVFRKFIEVCIVMDVFDFMMV